MAKIVKLEVTTCSSCPFCDRNGDYGRSYDSGYDCRHEKTPHTRIIDDEEMSRGKKCSVPIPEWCPLPDKKG